MNETKDHIGNNSTSRRKKTKTTASPINGVRRMDERVERQFGSEERPTEISSNLSTSDAFLRMCFLPKLKQSEMVAKYSKTKVAKMQRDFYKSLSHLAEHYSVQPMATKKFAFPYNVSLSLWDIEKQLKSKIANWDNIRLVQKENTTFFALRERCNTGTNLFYIPVLPIYKMLKNKESRKASYLLLSVCAYLYRIADIPYYRQEGSYLYWMYEMMTDWIEQDEEADDNHQCKKELRRAEIIGDFMEQKISDSHNLLFFKHRLKGFKPKSTFDKECFELAELTFKLYSEYPMESLYRNVYFNNAVESENVYDDIDNDDNEETTISMDKYISFFAESNGIIYQNIIDSVNNEFNEYGDVQEPMIFKTFDGKDISDKSLDFENRVFRIINKLCAILH
ncbi:hypothetical protein [Chryseobacterium aquaticum]|uniref:Uncharacterized protein n=1 Tax=Chryseobacterium aquaticum subsp. greenlandense TaxID=345663 RepID=A0A117KD07_9FLAO|nr:hypothetical protein [Chryseobacterium aquaticum]KUJ58346.1 hypothetical protein AR686_00640 [Chryseobacterium aquaticum subsp. greenlandense]